jgi:uncharacterized repeat protein (TIGR03803 family)
MVKRQVRTVSPLIAVLLAGLSGGAGTAHAATYHRIHQFHGGWDGANPVGLLAQMGGDLFGVTAAGGGTCNCGTVFKLTTSGVKTVLHKFAGAPHDGATPAGGLVVFDGAIYGTTNAGGPNTCNFIESEYECGMVFRITPSGVETVLHFFTNSEAWGPSADLIAGHDAVWGTSKIGNGAGEVYKGAVFKTGASGTTTSYGLGSGADGYLPLGALVKVGDAFYGTTDSDAFDCSLNLSAGSVYEMSPRGQFSAVYQFTCHAGPTAPNGNLAYRHGALFGIASNTVFKVTLSNALTSLYTFGGGRDGSIPTGGLTEVHNVFYGTTAAGGGTGCGGYGCGTIYAITPDGHYKQIYRFKGGNDGANPESQLLAWNGVLYGTTSAGGGKDCNGSGCGTVFQVTP